MNPDRRYGKNKGGSKAATHSVDAFLAMLYEGVAETLPTQFVVLMPANMSLTPSQSLRYCSQNLLPLPPVPHCQAKVCATWESCRPRRR